MICRIPKPIIMRYIVTGTRLRARGLDWQTREADPMLYHRLRPWPSITPTLAKRLDQFDVMVLHHSTCMYSETISRDLSSHDHGVALSKQNVFTCLSSTVTVTGSYLKIIILSVY